MSREQDRLSVTGVPPPARRPHLASLLEVHGCCSDFDFKPVIASTDFQKLPGFKAERLAQRFGNDNPSGGIDGSSHGSDHAKKIGMDATDQQTGGHVWH